MKDDLYSEITYTRLTKEKKAIAEEIAYSLKVSVSEVLRMGLDELIRKTRP